LICVLVGLKSSSTGQCVAQASRMESGYGSGGFRPWYTSASHGIQGCVCEVGPSRPCAHGLQAHLFAALARSRARPAAAKTDAAARLGRNAARVRFSRARLRAAHWGDFGAAAGGSRGLAREQENSSAPFPPRGNGDPPANHRGYKVRVAPRFGSSPSCSLHLPLPS
jgi:hypothetical protein